MSVLVTTSFSQGAVFYAGETMSCTITFTNTLPSPSKSPSNSSSLTRPKSPRVSAIYQGATTNGAGAHSRSPSNSSLLDSVQEYSKSTTEPSKPPQPAAPSFTSLASSTLAYFTGYGQSTPTPPSPDVSQPPPRAYSSPPASEMPIANGNDDAPWHHGNDEQLSTGGTASQEEIPIELDSYASPRMSFDMLPELPASSSRRSSIDSTTSTSSAQPYAAVQYRQQLAQSPMAHPANARRLSRLLKSPSTPSLMKKPEHLLWGFAQVVGQFVVDANLINAKEFEPVKHRTMYQPQGAGFGGGGGMTTNKHDSKLDTRTTPVFSTPPSILFVDLDLAPGESKKFTYKLKLPNDLPPTHRGKTIRFQYYLVVGTQRAGGAASARPSAGHIVQLRFRVLNHVYENGIRPIYDLMNPVVMVKDEARVDIVPDRTGCRGPRGSISSLASLPTPHTSTPEGVRSAESQSQREQFLLYVNDLLEKSQQDHDIQEITRRESNAYDEQPMLYDEDQDDAMTEQAYRKTCAQIVSRIVHASRKAMYDLCKSNQRVAKLQLTKTDHRLGEPIQGVLDFSEATLATYKVSITLESHEVIEPSICLRPQAYINRVSKKSHSDFHAFCLTNRRLAFSLPIPTTSSPDFQTTGVKLQYYLKFEFVTSNSNDTTAPPFLCIQRDDRHQHYQSQEHIPVSTFDCQIPVKVYGSPSGADRTIYGQIHTFPVS
ncbi:Rgp1-domain-containing protein [Hesseltinella vesiculosa]|uniref:Rgp1-domain-containing protein n=1 Tax=Hesseltinella vesiculosa TaxID=101127 RepID=A0A1X2GAH8_9FUNG|nr:Rgp1-domain-containing protein [Hesseltinella vesiculosa]